MIESLPFEGGKDLQDGALIYFKDHLIYQTVNRGHVKLPTHKPCFAIFKTISIIVFKNKSFFASLNFICIFQISSAYSTFSTNMLFWLAYSDFTLSLSEKQEYTDQKSVDIKLREYIPNKLMEYFF